MEMESMENGGRRAYDHSNTSALTEGGTPRLTPPTESGGVPMSIAERQLWHFSATSRVPVRTDPTRPAGPMGTEVADRVE